MNEQVCKIELTAIGEMVEGSPALKLNVQANINGMECVIGTALSKLLENLYTDESTHAVFVEALDRFRSTIEE